MALQKSLDDQLNDIVSSFLTEEEKVGGFFVSGWDGQAVEKLDVQAVESEAANDTVSDEEEDQRTSDQDLSDNLDGNPESEDGANYYKATFNVEKPLGLDGDETHDDGGSEFWSTENMPINAERVDGGGGEFKLDGVESAIEDDEGEGSDEDGEGSLEDDHGEGNDVDDEGEDDLEDDDDEDDHEGRDDDGDDHGHEDDDHDGGGDDGEDHVEDHDGQSEVAPEGSTDFSNFIADNSHFDFVESSDVHNAECEAGEDSALFAEMLAFGCDNGGDVQTNIDVGGCESLGDENAFASHFHPDDPGLFS